MAIDPIKFQKISDKLIRELAGNDIELIEVVKGAYNPTTGKDSATVVAHPLKAYVSNFTVEEMDNDNFTIDDFKVMVQTELSINKDWLVAIGGKQMKIINIVLIVNHNKLIVQTLQVRAVV